MQTFTLDPRLKNDTAPVLSLPLSDLLLMDDARFPWLIMVPRRPGKAELIDLDSVERSQLTDEVAMISHALKKVTSCDKLNVATLGNAVRQLHIHVVARFTTDVAWPGPVWGNGEAVAYRPQERQGLIDLISGAIPV